MFLDPSSDPQRTGYHVIQSQVAIGSGGWFGKGFTLGTQKRLAFLPEQHTDFIFAVVGEELGFLGVTIALALFVFLFLRVVRVAARASDSFSSLVAFGLLASWFVHVVVNVGMTLNLMPITGHSAAVLQLRRDRSCWRAGSRWGSWCGSRARGGAGAGKRRSLL